MEEQNNSEDETEVWTNGAREEYDEEDDEPREEQKSNNEEYTGMEVYGIYKINRAAFIKGIKGGDTYCKKVEDEPIRRNYRKTKKRRSEFII